MRWVDLATSRPGTLITNVAAAALWLSFARVHLEDWLETGAAPILLVLIAETLVAVLFLVRRPARTVADDAVTWAVGVAGTLVPFLLRPAPTHDLVRLEIAGLAMAIGLTTQILGLVSLNRSFGIVAAEREIKTTGLYRAVRHPVYLAYVFVWSGYLVASTTAWNAAVYAVALALTVERIRREERLLLGNPEYRAYAARVRWRLLPFLW